MPEHISIHALRKESDFIDFIEQVFIEISIHALRKESDRVVLPPQTTMMYFNPRSP